MHRDELENLVMEKIATMTKPADCGVIAKTTPVISFGDFTTSRIATLGINPSSAEFLSAGKLIVGDKQRLAVDVDAAYLPWISGLAVSTTSGGILIGVGLSIWKSYLIRWALPTTKMLVI